jgi:hypothetical protein
MQAKGNKDQTDYRELPPENDSSCLFCQRKSDPESILLENDLAFVCKDKYPVTKGHRLHYNTERAHQSLGNKMINPGIENMPSEGKILCDPRLGEMLNSYYRKAA